MSEPSTRAPAFGEVLRHHRRTAGLTQEALAERAGLSVRAISDLERGVKQHPRRDTLALLVQPLGLHAAARQALAAAAYNQSPPAPAGLPSAPGGEPPLVGRTYEISLLERHLAGTGPPLLLLAGEPGIGKSRLLRDAARRGARHGLCVLAGGCGGREAQEPYAPLPAALLGYLRRQRPAPLRAALQECAWLVRLLPELADAPVPPLPTWHVTPEQERRLMIEAVERFLANVAGPAGTLLVLDDLQWAGPDALAVLGALVRAAGTRLRVLGAYRDTEVGHAAPLAVLLADLAPAGVLARHLVPPLAPAEAARLLDVLLDAPPQEPPAPRGPRGASAGGGDPAAPWMPERSGGADPSVAPALRTRVLERTGGVPFFLLSYAQALRLGQQAPEGEPTDGEPVPWDVGQSIRQRVAALPASAADILAIAALIDRAVDPALLTAVIAHPEEEVLEALDAACRVRLLAESAADVRAAPPYRFAHDAIREVIAADLGRGRRRALHRRIAEAVEREDQASGRRWESAVEALAYHYLRSDTRQRALPYLEQAGDRARQQAAWAAAAAHYGAALELLAAQEAGREDARLREKVGLSLRHAARYDAAVTPLEQAADTYRTSEVWEGVCRVLAELGHIYADTGRIDTGVARILPVLARLDRHDAPSNLAGLYAVLAKLYYFGADYPKQLAAAERAMALARETADPWTQAEALWSYSGALRMVGRTAEALPLADEASAVAETAGNLFARAQALEIQAAAYWDRNEATRARAYIDEAVVAADQLGDPGLLMYMEAMRGSLTLDFGDWRQARASLERVLAISRDMAALFPTGYALAFRGELAMREGEWERAARYLHQALAAAERVGHPWMLLKGQCLLAEHAILCGHPAEACARLAPLIARPDLQESDWIPQFQSLLAWAHLALGDVRRAEEITAAVVARVQASSFHEAIKAEAWRVQALVAIRQEQWTRAEASLEQGDAFVRLLQYPYTAGRYLQLQGQVLAGQGREEMAGARYAAALRIFQRLGARPDAEQTERALSALGARGASLAP